MPDNRLKGQDTQVLLVQNGTVLDTITDVKDLEITLKFDRLQEGYLGETTDRYDEIFRGAQGKTKLHYENTDVFDLIALIIDRARRRQAGVKVNIKTTLNFPNGQRRRIIVPDVAFGDIPLGWGAREAYGSVDLDFGASQARFI